MYDWTTGEFGDMLDELPRPASGPGPEQNTHPPIPTAPPYLPYLT